MNDWEEFEERMNLLGIDLSDKTRKTIEALSILRDIGEKQEAGEITEETARKAALALYEKVK